MKVIEIKRKNGNIYNCFVDDDDFEKVNKYKWHIKKIGHNIYAEHWLPKQKTLLMHWLVLDFPGKMIDHKDCNGLNNQKSNLRFCNKSQNAINSKKKNGSSVYKGVHFVGYGWEACVMKDYKKYHLGTYKEEKEAALAYNKAAIKYHGEFAKLNQL